MKEKLELLLREGHLANLPEFENLHKNYLVKAEKLKKNKVTFERARKVYEEKSGHGRMDLLYTLEPKTVFLVAKYRKKIAKTEFELAKKRLEIWLESFLKRAENVEISKNLDKTIKEIRDEKDKTPLKKAPKKPVESPSTAAKSNRKSKKVV